MHVSPMENPTCAAFEEYEEVPETVPLDFSEDDVMWVASKISGAAGALRAEAIELSNFLLCFRCDSEEFIVIVADLSNCMANSSPHWDDYCNMMTCPLIALDKWPGVRPVGIGETLRRSIDKFIMRAAGDQAKTLCGSLQMCSGLEAGIEGAIHAVVQRRYERHIPEPGCGADEESEGAEDESVEATSRTERVGEAMRVIGIG